VAQPIDDRSTCAPIRVPSRDTQSMDEAMRAPSDLPAPLTQSPSHRSSTVRRQSVDTRRVARSSVRAAEYSLRSPPTVCHTGPVSTLDVRQARRDDLPAIVRMLADDSLGATRDSPDDLEPYLLAFEQIDADPNQFLAVAVSDGGAPVGTLQLTVIPGLARQGALRGQIEAVRVRADHRGSGLGAALMKWAIAEFRRRGCSLVQLTSDISRPDAHRFYVRLGFVPSHTGFKLQL